MHLACPTLHGWHPAFHTTDKGRARVGRGPCRSCSVTRSGSGDDVDAGGGGLDGAAVGRGGVADVAHRVVALGRGVPVAVAALAGVVVEVAAVAGVPVAVRPVLVAVA